MSKKDFKEYEQQIINLIDNPVQHDYRKHAFEELEQMEKKTKKNFPNIAFIINEYPDFNSVCLKVTQPNHFVFQVFINPYDYKDLPPKKKKKAIKKLMQMIFAFGGSKGD
ncbi:MAG: hypothetical protein J6S85_18595 [Methanobrevibacter sp.]|nr:hypothetical protein [Methanobrevibacter sp.]